MKKSILIIGTVLLTFSLTAFGYINWVDKEMDSECSTSVETELSENNAEISSEDAKGTDVLYKIDNRFLATITKEKLSTANAVSEIIPKTADWSTYPVQVLKVTVRHNGTETSEIGDGLVLNEAQIKLLRSAKYNDNFSLNASCKGKHKYVYQESYDLHYVISVTPEKEAEYSQGKEELISYLMENSKAQALTVVKDLVQPGRILFTVTAEGTIGNVVLNSSSGFAFLDLRLVELLNNLPEKWEPATNDKGEYVEQDLVFFFGSMGC